MKNLLVTVPITDLQKAKLEAALGDRMNITYKPGKEVTQADLADKQALFGNIAPSLLTGAKELEWVQLNSAGADKYLVPGVLPEGVILRNAVGAYGRAVSEHMVAMTFSLVRKLNLYSENQTKNLWKDEGSVTSVEDSTVLVLGLGDIGGSYAKKMKALGAYVIGVRHSDKAKPDYVDEQYLLGDLEKLIPRADIIASVLPSTEETKNLFNSRTLALCRPGAYIINAGRGDAVDQEALKAALDENRIGGAALDVTVPEPLPADDTLWNYRNVLITPHVAGGFHLAQTLDRIVELAIEHANEWLAES